ncbi:hypothetical protein G9A89_012260 [Geosiphon pyriformis]|nr:hypothetical protein G9A89_012260 [Geosiphon pyriformis]
MAEEEIVDQGEIILTGQAISISSYGQYMVGIKWKVKEQNQIFEAETTLCKSREIKLINLYIPVKDYSHIKISIYNNTRNVIVILAGTTIGYLSTEIEDQPPSTISDFSQLCGYVNITLLPYCEEKYPVQSKYSFDFESETETSNKGKQRLKQYSRTTPNTTTLQKTTAKHLQTPEQGTSVKLPLSITLFPISLQEPISTSTNIINYLQENKSNHSESLESKETESELEEFPENEEEMATAYIAKIPEFIGKDNDTSPQEWLDKVQKAGDANAGLKDKLIKKVCPHVPADLATVIKQAKSYEMAMEKANHTKLVNLAIGETSSAAEKKIDQLTKKVESYFTNQQQQPQQPQRYQPPQQCNQNNFGSSSNNQSQNCHYCGIPGHWKRDCRKLQRDQQNRSNQHYSSLQQFYYQYPLPTYYSPRPQNQNKESDFQQTALSEGEIAAPRSNSSNHTIPPAQIAQNANLSDIFPFEFEANESPFLLSNTAVNEQKAITAMYTEATVKGKPIRLILDSGSAGSIITYQLMQQLKRNIDKPAQTVIVTADGMKKTPVGEIDNFSFSIDRITIPVKVLVIDAPQYQALVGNDWLLKANANLNWETQELKISYQGQYTIVPATCGTFNKQSEKALVFEFKEEKEMPLTETYMALGSTFNWAEETEQKIFKESRGWKKVRYSTPEPQKQPLYIPLKCKDCNKKLLSMGACISPEEEYETRTYYFCKACHRE